MKGASVKQTILGLVVLFFLILLLKFLFIKRWSPGWPRPVENGFLPHFLCRLVVHVPQESFCAVRVQPCVWQDFVLTFNVQLPGKTQSMSAGNVESATELLQTAKIDHDVSLETGPRTLVGRQTQSEQVGSGFSSSSPGNTPVLVSCSHCGGDLYLEGVTCPRPQCYMPFIAGCGDGILSF